MILDRTGLLSENQAITASAASTNVLDLKKSGIVYGAGAATRRDIGKGTKVPFAVRVTQAFNNLTSLTISFQQADDAAFTQNLETIFTSPAYALADLGIGKRLLLPDQIPIGANRQFLRLFYTVAGTAPTTGQIYSGVTMGDQTNG